MELIRKIVYLTYQIHGEYMKLYEMDVKGKKDTLEYLTLIYNLKCMIVKEKKLYESFGNDRDSYLKLLEFASMHFDEEVVSRIYGYMLLNNRLVVGSGEIGAEKQLDEGDYKLYMVRTKNIILMQFSFIQEYIESMAFDNVRDKLIYTIYCSGFINPYMSEYLANCNFNISLDLFVDFYFIADMMRIDYNDSSSYMLDGCVDMIRLSLDRLFSVNDNYYNSLANLDNNEVVANRKSDIIISQCMLRAGISLLDDSQFEIIKDEINSIINARVNNFNRISMGIVNSIVDGRKMDRCRVRSISIK